MITGRSGRSAVIELIKQFAGLPAGAGFTVGGGIEEQGDPWVIVNIGDFWAVFTPDEARSVAGTLEAFMAEMPYRQPWDQLAEPLRHMADALEQPQHSVH